MALFRKQKNVLQNPGKTRLTLDQIGSTGGQLRIRDVSNALWFPAGQPINPVAPRGTPPRRYPYQPMTNINWASRDGQIDHVALRNFSYYPIVRDIIETLKDLLMQVDWDFVLKPESDDESGESLKQRTAEDKRLQQLRDFFRKPDGWQSFRVWCRGLYDDMLVLDAASVWKQRDQNGKICSLVQIDGAQVFPLIDETGQQPDAAPYSKVLVQTSLKKADQKYQEKVKFYKDKNNGLGSPAFQLTPYGFPAQEMTSKELTYAVYNRFTYRRYGFSKLEACLSYVAIALGRLDFQAAFYRAGNVPEGIAFLPPDVPIQKVDELNKYLDSILAGNLRNRRKIFFLPSYGTDKQPNLIFPKVSEQVLKDEFDEWLARVLCHNFGLSPMAFTKQINRGEAKNQQEAQSAEGVAPCLAWMKDLLDDFIQEDFGWQDIEAKPQPKPEKDEEKLTNVLVSQFESGLAVYNEARDKLGYDTIDAEWAEVPLVKVQTGYVRIDGLPMDGGEEYTPGSPGYEAQQKDNQGDGGQGGDQGGGQDNKDEAPPEGEPDDAAGKTTGAFLRKNWSESARLAAHDARTGKHDDQVAHIHDMAASRHDSSAAAERTLGASAQRAGRTESAIAHNQAAESHVAARDMHRLASRMRNEGAKWPRAHRVEASIEAQHATERAWTATGKAEATKVQKVGQEWGPAYATSIEESSNDQSKEAAPRVQLKDEKRDKNTEWFANSNIPETVEGKAAVATKTATGEPYQWESDWLKKATKRGKGRDWPNMERTNAYIGQSRLTPESHAARTALKDAFEKLFGKLRKRFEKKLHKAEGDEDLAGTTKEELQAEINKAIEEDFWRLAPFLSKELEKAAISGLDLSTKDLNIDDSGIIEKVNVAALKAAQERGAEMVGKRWEAGELVDNPDAKWSILNTTREAIKGLITKTFEGDLTINDARDAIQKALSEDGPGGIFSDYRADMIARMEPARAQMTGQLEFWKASGLPLALKWFVTSEEPCEDCEMNDGAVVAIGEPFPDGSFSTLDTHPWCNCICSAVLDTGEGDEED